MRVIIGVDIGQKRDPTAICVAEPDRRVVGGREEAHFLIRYLARLPLGTPYTRVAATVGEITAAAARRTGSAPTLYVDATGVGQPIVDLLRERADRATIKAVYFTRGDRRSEAGDAVTLGKAYLVSLLQGLLQQGRIHLPRTAEAEALARELLDYEIQVDENGTDRYGAFKVGTHDDLVTALGLTVQEKPTQLWFA
jgi:hypothetical protein